MRTINPIPVIGAMSFVLWLVGALFALQFFSGCIAEPSASQRIEADSDGYPLTWRTLPVTVQPGALGTERFKGMFDMSGRGYPRIFWGVAKAGKGHYRYKIPGTPWVGLCEYWVTDAEDEQQHTDGLAGCLGIIGSTDEEALNAVREWTEIRGPR